MRASSAKFGFFRQIEPSLRTWQTKIAAKISAFLKFQSKMVSGLLDWTNLVWIAPECGKLSP
jgi:hypothetical protein